MPIPFIIAGVALAAGAYGVKKGFDAKSDFNDANEINEQAQRIYDNAARKLETTREKAQDSLSALGELKFSLYKDKLIPFVAAFKKIHNIGQIARQTSPFRAGRIAWWQGGSMPQ